MHLAKPWKSLLAATIALSPVIASADSTSQMFAPDRVGKWYLGGGLGGFWEESNSNLSNQSGQFGGFFSAGYRLHPNVAVEIDALSSYQRVDRPAGVTDGDGRSRLTTTGGGGVVKLILPIDRLELYVGGGAGAYRTDLRVKDNPFKSEEDDTSFGYQGLAGGDYFISRNLSVGLEYRKFKTKADLDPSVPGGKIDAGGDFVFATVRGHF
ncbi:MAG TPA: porin family protein [Burkholderiales bacterium]|nr:porin family protein [Burkholderiales bacterium]